MDIPYIVQRVVTVSDHGEVPVQVGTVNVPDTVGAANRGGEAMRRYTSEQGGTIAEGKYRVMPAASVEVFNAKERRTMNLTKVV